MLRTNVILSATLSGAMLATPVLAATESDCLQHNRFMSWHAVDENTLIFSDRFMKPYTVKMENGCLGVTRGDAHFDFVTWQDMACLDRSTIIYIVAPGLPRARCFISSVHAGAPESGPGQPGR